MTETDALSVLRSTVAQLDQYDQLALAAFLVGTSNPKFPGFTMPQDGTVETNLAEACELARTFPNATKIFFAIELLELQIDRDEFDEDDGLPDPGHYEGEEYYGSDLPALGTEEDSDYYY